MSGGNATIGVDALIEHGVKEEDIYILTIFATPRSELPSQFSSYMTPFL